MTEKDFHPLSSSCVKNLQDKLYDKRKTGALEIEKMIREFRNNGNINEIENILMLLGKEFVGSSNCHTRKGGLISLAAAAIGLEKMSYHYCPFLVAPVIRCLYDTDSRVRYYACESLYNIVKITKGEALLYFNDIFDALSKCAADPDPSVRKGSAQLDHMLKDIVMESSSFDITALIPLLREIVYTKNTYARQFVVSWVTTLESVPDINIVGVLPEILDGLFQILNDRNFEIRQQCETLLEELLNAISKSSIEVNFSAMINILIAQCQFSTPDNESYVGQLTAVRWLLEFLVYARDDMLPYTSGILAAILPYLAYKDPVKRSVMEVASKLNEQLLQIVKTERSSESILTGDTEESASLYPSPEDRFMVGRTVEVLCRLLSHDCELTRISAIRWLETLLDTRPNKLFLHTEEIFPILLEKLLDTSTSLNDPVKCPRNLQVVYWDLTLLVKLSVNPAGLSVFPQLPGDLLKVPAGLVASLPPDTNPFLLRFMLDLVGMLDTRPRMLADRGDLIITDLCNKLGAENIFQILAEIVIQVNDLESTFTLVQAFNRILLTQITLHDFRSSLRAINTESACFLFRCLYRAWSHNVVALLSLCLLTQNYEHSSHLIKFFGEVEITVETLAEIDQLIQLLESPIFAFLRLHLLDFRHSVYLQETLYCLLMCLPQTEAFLVLRRRLDCVPRHPIQNNRPVAVATEEPDRELIAKHVNFDQLLDHFQDVQNSLRLARIDRAKGKLLG